MIKLLLSFGADPQREDNDGRRPVDDAVHHLHVYAESLAKDPHTRRRYLKCRAMLATTTVHKAAKEGDRQVDSYRRPRPSTAERPNKYGMTPFTLQQCKATTMCAKHFQTQVRIGTPTTIFGRRL